RRRRRYGGARSSAPSEARHRRHRRRMRVAGAARAVATLHGRCGCPRSADPGANRIATIEYYTRGRDRCRAPGAALAEIEREEDTRTTHAAVQVEAPQRARVYLDHDGRRDP